ncbi:MAG: carboxylating nicotinate-nucleotide diphosphorylase [Litorilinea sp.]
MSPTKKKNSLTPFDWRVVQNELDSCIQRALDEDVADGDITTLATIPAELTYTGHMIAKAEGVVAGLAVAERVFTLLDAQVRFTPQAEEGDLVQPRDCIAIVEGPARALLTGERTALNFLQRMSGIATLTRRYVEAVRDTQAAILDTRKTVPGLRLLDKWAVALGGGVNHRIGLYDMVMIKDNHITAAGGITAAVERVRQADARNRPIEVEVKNLDELQEALQLKLDQIMLDNMDVAEMARAVEIVDGRVALEASGNVSLDTVTEIAETGVDYISVGKLTHSVMALDISFLLTSD